MTENAPALTCGVGVVYLPAMSFLCAVPLLLPAMANDFPVAWPCRPCHLVASPRRR